MRKYLVASCYANLPAANQGSERCHRRNVVLLCVGSNKGADGNVTRGEAPHRARFASSQKLIASDKSPASFLTRCPPAYPAQDLELVRLLLYPPNK